MLFIAAFIYLIYGNSRECFWSDEAFTAEMMKFPFKEIFGMTGGDFHPPLYYIMLHPFTGLFGISEVSLRAFSALGIIALMSLGPTAVRRIFDEKTGLIFSLLVLITPACFTMAQDAKMYSWAAYFTAGAMIYSCAAVSGNKTRDWVIYCLFSILAAYTHYYGLLAVILTLTVILFIILARKIPRLLIKLLIVAFITGLAYLPWFFTLIRQSAYVSGHYWVPRPDYFLIKNVVLYPFDYKIFFFPDKNIVIADFMFIYVCIIYGIVSSIIKRGNTLLQPLLCLRFT